MIPQPVQRFISRFEINNELSFEEIQFKIEPSLKDLRNICGFKDNDLIYEEVKLNKEMLEKLRIYVENDFDENKYIYFLSCSNI